MRSVGRILAVISVLVLIAVVTLAALALLAFPLVLALELAVLALVAGIGTRLRRRTRRRGAMQWTTRWASGPPVEAVPLARQQVADLLARWGVSGVAAEPTALVVTELLSNAAEHGLAPVRLTVGLDGPLVRVEVRDSAAGPPRLQPHDPLRVRGRGLQLVDALATRWGWTGDPPGKVVWAEVPTSWPA
jgi:anti-sigma regulatory factor (Ser/Thr protein kinase)